MRTTNSQLKGHVMSKRPQKKIWLVPHPTSQFKEDVKELAAQKGLKIIDARFAGQVPAEAIAKDTPKLTPVKAAKKDEAEQAAIDKADAAAKKGA